MLVRGGRGSNEFAIWKTQQEHTNMHTLPFGFAARDTLFHTSNERSSRRSRDEEPTCAT